MSPRSASPVSEAGKALVTHARDGFSAPGDGPLHLAIGMFDGVHLGHQAVILQAVNAASREGHLSGVLTFDPHPSHVLYPERATAMLMPLEQRIHHMLLLGVDFVFVQPFTRDYARREAGEFVSALKEVFPALAGIHVGENFRYGSGRSGDVMTLRDTARAAGIELLALPREHLDGETISSSRIRTALADGDIQLAGAMLGSPYLVEGKIVPGKGLGRRMEYPTLNVQWNPGAKPRFGVYRVLLYREGVAGAMPGVANYGVRPTIGGSTEPVLEVHLLDPQIIPGEGDWVCVALMDFIRDERAFPSIQALREQIRLDVARVREQAATGTNPPSRVL